MAIKQWRVRKEICLSSKQENKNDIKYDTDLNQTNNKYPLQL